MLGRDLTMFHARLEALEGGRVQKFCVVDGTATLSYSHVLGLWQSDEAFRSFFISLLAAVPFAAYRWETPPVTIATVHREFEFVIFDSPGLALPPDPTPFESYFAGNSDSGIVVFDNLGGDATLVVPCPFGPESAYGHLAAFTRQAPQEQIHALWRIVGSVMQQRLGDRPLWLSTAGGGVAWLHVRLDSYPKYYGFQLYREFQQIIR